jgi:hypothetical protein
MADTAPQPGARRLLRRQIVWGCLVGLLLALVLELVYLLLGANFRAVVPGLVYRSSRLSPSSLEDALEKYGIRTVINLRGCCEPAPWYLEQSRILNRHNVSMEDVGCSAGRLPSVVTIRQLVQILDQTEYPIMIHCHRGIDRTGLVAAMALLLHSNVTLDEALEQLSWRYAHIPFGRTGNMERFFVLYREWLERTGQDHSPATFRQWAEHDYCPGEGLAHFEVIAPSGPVIRLAAEQPALVTVRCHNSSVKPWHFKPGLTAGVHLQYMLVDGRDHTAVWSRTGLRYATVQPGESIDIDIPLPSLKPGRYTLRADLIDEQHASFFQLGSLPLFQEVEVQ